MLASQTLLKVLLAENVQCISNHWVKCSSMTIAKTLFEKSGDVQKFKIGNEMSLNVPVREDVIEDKFVQRPFGTVLQKLLKLVVLTLVSKMSTKQRFFCIFRT